MSFTINAKADSARAARDSAAETASNVLNALDTAPNANLSPDDVSTLSVSLTPVYTPVRVEGTTVNRPDGYRFTQTMQVTGTGHDAWG